MRLSSGKSPMERKGSLGAGAPQAGCDIVKRGCLHVKHPPSFLPATLSIQPWKKRYVILRDSWHSPYTTTTLDLYDSESAVPLELRRCSSGCTSADSRGHPYAVDLRDVAAVGVHQESRRFQFAFYIERRNDRTLVFAADTDLDMRCWIAAIRTLADKVQLNEFNYLPSRSIPNSPSVQSARDPVSSGRRLSHSAILNRRQLNLSAPQLVGVTGVAQCTVTTASVRRQLQRKLTAPEIGCSRLTGRDINAAAEQLQHQSPEGALNCTEQHPWRRIFSSSIFASITRSDGGNGRRKAFSKDRRKDSGFSESFDDIEPVLPSDTLASQLLQEEETHSGGEGEFSPVPPPRPPRRQEDNTSSPMSCRPLPPRPTLARGTGEINGHCRDTPPTPPPRPAHTLSR